MKALTYTMKHTLRWIYAVAINGTVHADDVNTTQLDALRKRGLVVRPDGSLRYTITPKGLEVLEEIEATWEDTALAEYPITETMGKFEVRNAELDRRFALISTEGIRARMVERAERDLANLEAKLEAKRTKLEALRRAPEFTHVPEDA